MQQIPSADILPELNGHIVSEVLCHLSQTGKYKSPLIKNKSSNDMVRYTEITVTCRICNILCQTFLQLCELDYSK